MTRWCLAAALVFVSAVASAQQPPDNPFGMGWGAGMGFSANTIGVPLVEPGGAFIDELGIIRITHPLNVKSRILMESHYTFRVPGSPLGIGPVIMIQPSGDGLFDAAGGGVLIELGEGDRSFNFIVGLLVDFDVSRLHRDYVDGFRSPTAELVFVTREEVQLVVGFAIGLPGL